MKSRTALVLLSFIACSLYVSAAPADDRRFSSTLNVADSTQTGLNRLSSDQVAVLDALVRNDAVVADADPSPKVPRAAQFSQRLATNERELAGLALLSDSELAQLNASVEQFIHPPLRSEIEADTPGNGKRLNSIMLRRGPEIHGSVTLMVGGGSNGYSEYGGALDLIYYDPAHHFALEVGYSEIHSSGGYGGYCNRLFPYSYRRPNTLLSY